MSSTVEQIKQRLSIEDIVSSYIKLEKAGSNLKARCPFHNEKTPSFVVSPERGSYYCFGCGAKGDIFTFVQEFESVDFIGALKLLADKAGVQLENKNFEKDNSEGRLYKLLDETTKFLAENLSREEIPLEYLKNRGLTDLTINDWQIGYVRDEWRSISDHLRNKNFSDKEMERAGITKTENGSTYDRFRGRIMFPIFDAIGRPIAFSGRILHDDGKSAKYLNSPQTELFDKSKVLYGYNAAKQAIKKFDFSIIVEGQMDLLMCHQAGFNNAVASSGTALTADHLRLVQRISNNVIMSFDSDNAGAKAAEKAWILALSIGMEVKIAALPKGSDPADLILANKDQFKQILKNGIHPIDFLINRIVENTPEKNKIWIKIRAEVLPYIYVLSSDTERGRFVSKISEIIGIKEELIFDDLKKVRLSDDFHSDKTGENKSIDRKLDERKLKSGSPERALASIIAKFNDIGLEEKIKNILDETNYQKFLSELEKEKSELAFEAEEYFGKVPEEKLKIEIEKLLKNLNEEKYKTELSTLLSELKKAEKSQEMEKVMSIVKRVDEITKRINNLKN